MLPPTLVRFDHLQLDTARLAHFLWALKVQTVKRNNKKKKMRKTVGEKQQFLGENNNRKMKRRRKKMQSVGESDNKRQHPGGVSQ